ncbi:hypothetical protein [Caulobacter sp. 602-1]|uniref:hypothetical protein n=1 Tax=Caulobacter sp. 602-1 TaxID=2492472 RepID=UPI000F6448D6|nr:hypothetical protein [Caulobacter sp. 602-1]RRN65254.1 hypothetical protein EIK80_06750 [Caulobacter sp. 602-1]
MAYTTQQLVDAYTNANLGKTPDAATTLAIDAYASGTTTGAYSDTQALANTLKLVGNTTAVAIETYQFFTNHAPSAAGLSYLVNSTTNANDLNDAYYAKFSAENRFINFSINLATGAGEGAAAFAASYGSVSYAQTVATAYDKIIGNSVATAAGVDVAASVAFFSRAENITYLTNFVKANTTLTTAADIDLAVKAALIGEILNAAFQSGLGGYAGSTNAMIADLSDGSLSTDAAAGVNILTAYPSAGAVGTTYTLTPGADPLTGTNANDTFNALSIKADGTNATTFSSFDAIDGGAGVDTLNIYTDDTGVGFNMSLPSSTTVKNVEIVNILNAGATAAALADASKYQGVQELWQVNKADAVTNLATGVIAGFKNFTAAATFDVATNATAASAKVALSNVAEASTVNVDGSASDALASVTLSGTVADTNSDGSVAATVLNFKVGDDVTSVSVSSAFTTTLTVIDAGSTDKVTSVDLSGSTGAITFVGDTDVANIVGGAGKDDLTIATTTVKDNSATPADETVSAVLNAGAGNDTITINTTGAGTTTVSGGAGNDTITHTGHGTGKLTVDLGDGDDKFLGTGVVAATDFVDGGAGIDTLRLSVVGSANIGAFSNFERFDVVGMSTNLDVDILASKNTVSEIVSSGALSATSGVTAVLPSVTLSNIGAGVGFRATADNTYDANTFDPGVQQGVLNLTQKTAGALTVTVDTDGANDGVATADVVSGIVATNATSLTAAFAADHADTKANTATLNVTGSVATSLTVTSGGTNVSNVLNYTSAVNASTTRDYITSVTVTGDKALTLDLVVGTAAVTSVDASAFTGALTFDLSDMRNAASYGSVLKLGAGDDVITLSNGRAIQGVELGTGENATLVTNFDVLKATGAAQAADIAATATITLKDGLLTFNGAGPATLADAITLADGAAVGAGASVVFQYLSDSYVFVQGGGSDTVVKLVGATGLHGIDTVTTDSLYVF